jgi:glucose/arabinose dehydrogenase
MFHLTMNPSAHLVIVLAAAALGGTSGTPSAAETRTPAKTNAPIAVPAPKRCAAGGDCGPFVGFKGQAPGRSHLIRTSDLPAPNPDDSIDNGPRLVPRPAKAWPQAPAGFMVQLYADGLVKPRALRVAPNGDVFVAESKANTLRVLRGVTEAGRAARVETYAAKTGLNQPFGLAFYPPSGTPPSGTPRWLYVGNTDQVVRFAYTPGDLRARGVPEVIVPDLPGGGLLRGGGHWTRDLAFSLDGKTMFVAVGSRSNVDDPDDTPAERHRANVLAYTPDGTGMRVFASGIRNPVGITVHPRSGAVWASVN